LIKVKATLEDAKTQATDESMVKAGLRYAMIAKAIGVKLTDDDAPTKIDAEVTARDDAYTKVDGEYKLRLDALKEWRSKKLADLSDSDRGKYREAVSNVVTGHIKRFGAVLAKLEAKGVDVTDVKAKVDAWLTAWNAATTKEAKMAVITTINSEWPGIRASLQEKFELASADELATRVLSVAATARVTAAGVDVRGGDSSAIITAAAQLEGIAAKLKAATTVEQAKAAKAELEPALRELRQAVKTAVATVTGSVITPAPEASVTATAGAEATEEPTAAATVVATTTA
jgi:hypothetical protein